MLGEKGVNAVGFAIQREFDIRVQNSGALHSRQRDLRPKIAAHHINGNRRITQNVPHGRVRLLCQAKTLSPITAKLQNGATMR